MNQFFNNPSIILDTDLLNDSQRDYLENLGYIKDIYFYGEGYSALPVICWSKNLDEDVDISEWEDKNLPFRFEQIG